MFVFYSYKAGREPSFISGDIHHCCGLVLIVFGIQYLTNKFASYLCYSWTKFQIEFLIEIFRI